MEDYIGDFKGYIDISKKIHYLNLANIADKNTEYELNRRLLGRIIYTLEEIVEEYKKENPEVE